jgi:phosphatidylinositol glycan class P protein
VLERSRVVSYPARVSAERVVRGRESEDKARAVVMVNASVAEASMAANSPGRSPTSPVSPLAPFPPSPPESRSRAPEFYGFVAWTSTSLLFCLFLLWGLLPDEYILWLGVDWYPSRYVRISCLLFHLFISNSKREWALLLPAYSVVLIMLTYFVYWALAISATPSFSDMSTIVGTFRTIPNQRKGLNIF